MAISSPISPRPSINIERYNELLILRGDLSSYLKLLRNWADQLAIDNENKDGKRFIYPTVLFQILAIEHNFGKPFRMVEGFARMICNLLGFPAPRWTTIWYRIQKLTFRTIFTDAPIASKDESINGAVDSTGLKLNGPGEYLNDKHHPSKKKEYVKLHALADTRTHQILIKAVTPGYAHDSPLFRPIIHAGVTKYTFNTIWGDKAYGSHENFELLSIHKITPGLLLKSNATTHTRGGSFARTKTAWQIRRIGVDGWKKLIGYGNRWAVERSYSIFKLLFGERLQARKWPYILQEIHLKVEQMNHYLAELYSE